MAGGATGDGLTERTAGELAALIRSREASPVEVVEAFLARIEAVNPRLGAYVTVTAELALERAAEAEQRVMAGATDDLGPLHGVPVSIKELSDTAGVATTYASRAYAGHVPTADKEVVARLFRAGAVMLGKTNSPEFGLNATTEGGPFPPTRNPWDLSRSAGGSSGGAGAALAARLCPLAEGSDWGGSIRIPAAACGVAGLKPSRGRISAAPSAGEGWAGFATSGPMARTVTDFALALDVMAGPAVGDPYPTPNPLRSFAASLSEPLPRLRIRLLPCLVLAGSRDPVPSGPTSRGSEVGERQGKVGVDDPGGVLGADGRHERLRETYLRRGGVVRGGVVDVQVGQDAQRLQGPPSSVGAPSTQGGPVVRRHAARRRSGGQSDVEHRLRRKPHRCQPRRQLVTGGPCAVQQQLRSRSEQLVNGLAGDGTLLAGDHSVRVVGHGDDVDAGLVQGDLVPHGTTPSVPTLAASNRRRTEDGMTHRRADRPSTASLSDARRVRVAHLRRSWSVSARKVTCQTSGCSAPGRRNRPMRCASRAGLNDEPSDSRTAAGT